MTRIGSICSGYAGLDLAVREMIGGDLAWVADNDPGAAAVLAHHYPGVPNLGDVTAVDWDAVEQVDLMGGGFPCQDVSAAGARAGMKHGNRSGVWHEFVKAIAAQRPRMVVIENVLGLLTARGDEPTPEHLRAEASRDTSGRLLEWLANELAIAVGKGDAERARACRKRAARVTKAQKRAVSRCEWHEQRLIRAAGTVLAGLAGLGYDAEWVVVTAAAAGACHRRARLFILAFPAVARMTTVPGNPIAVIEDGVWLEARESLFGMVPFTGRIPASGRMAGGLIYAAEDGPTAAGSGLLPTPMTINSTSQRAQTGRLTSGPSRGGPSYGLEDVLLKTPTAQLAVNGGSQHPDKRRAGGHGPTLADQVEHELLPTPTARLGDDTSRGADPARFKGPQSLNGRRSNLDDCIAAVQERSPWLFKTPADELLPTPRATDGTKGGPNQRGSSGDLMLPSAVMSLLPTPTAADGDRTSAVYPRGDATLLGALLPTPTVSGSHGTDRRSDGSLLLPGVDTGRLLPTPAAGNFNDGESPEHWQSRKEFHAAKETDATRAGMPLTVAAQQLAGGVDWGPYEAAIRRWEAVLGRQAPPPTVPGRTGERLNPALPEFMMGLPEGWITDVPGLNRNAMLKLAGNGCVPQQVELALRILLDRAGISLTGERAA
jgi:DNA (cytosine-5)-methyltransferase 1